LGSGLKSYTIEADADSGGHQQAPSEGREMKTRKPLGEAATLSKGVSDIWHKGVVLHKARKPVESDFRGEGRGSLSVWLGDITGSVQKKKPKG